MRIHPDPTARSGGAAFSVADLAPPDRAAPPVVDVAPPRASPAAPVSLHPSSSRLPPDSAIQAAVGQTRRRIQAARNMEIPPAYTPPEIYDGPSNESPSDRTPVVEVIMPNLRTTPTAKRARVSKTRTDRTKRARCAVGSPTIRIINQIQMSTPTSVAPGSTASQDPRGSRTKNTTRQLRSVYWKEFDPIIENGEVVYAQCKHCHEYLSGKQSIGTSHLKKHLERCKLKAKLTQMVDKLRAGANLSNIERLENWVYDSDLARKALVRMIVLHELPFFIVEYDGFIEFVSCLNPLFKMVSRTTIKLDCMKTFEDAKLELREVFKNSKSKVSLTADMWTSNQNLGYLCVTCHWISSQWKMRKRIIKFIMMESPHNAQSMFNVILKGIQDWNIEDKLFSITLDNAQVNKSMMDLLRANLLLKKMLPCDGKLFHVRCGAHVINLVVQYGLRKISSIVSNIRESVKYVKSSQARKEKFEEVAIQMGISLEKQPSLDISTRWNSTYLMLKSAYKFRNVFSELHNQDQSFNTTPSLEEWKRSKAVRKFLKAFYDATVVLSGSSYPTANLYFHQLWKLKLAMDKEVSNEDEDIVAMVIEMQKKFMQYLKITYVSFSIPVILDPRFKYSFVEFRLKQFFGEDASPKLDIVMSTLRKLFTDYSRTNHADATASETNCAQVSTQKDDSFDDWDQYQRTQLRTQSSSEHNGYLTENTIPRTEELDILGWWKSNSTIYPVLARMAVDVLSTPASTVPSESAFSTGERVVSDFRSRLSTNTVEALICLQDWMRAAAPSPEKVVFEVVAQPVYKISISTLPSWNDQSEDYAVDHVEDHFDTDLEA